MYVWGHYHDGAVGFLVRPEALSTGRGGPEQQQEALHPLCSLGVTPDTDTPQHHHPLKVHLLTAQSAVKLQQCVSLGSLYVQSFGRRQCLCLLKSA